MFTKIHQVASPLVSFSEREKHIFESAFTFRTVPKNTLLIKEGEVAKEIYFINKGLMRLYYNEEGQHITAYIFRENLFAASYDSFLEQAPGLQHLETLEDCELLCLSREAMDQLYQDLPAMNILTRKIAEQRFINAQKLFVSFLLDSPEARYQQFLTHHGDLLLRIPHHVIASYLGITPVSLSRIRRRLQNKAE